MKYCIILGFFFLAISSTQGYGYNPYYQQQAQDNNFGCFPPSSDDVIPVVFDDDNPPSVYFPFKYFGKVQGPVYLSDNGMISFGKGIGERNPNMCAPYPGNIPLISPFWTDNTFREIPGGTFSYRISASSNDLQIATEHIRLRFPNKNVNLNSVLIVSWKNVGFYGAEPVGARCSQGTSLRNTYQLALASDGQQSFAMICYAKVQWTTATGAHPGFANFGVSGHTDNGDSCTGLGGKPAEAAFEDGMGHQVKISGSSCTSDVVNIDNQSNVGQPGKFVFQVNDRIE